MLLLSRWMAVAVLCLVPGLARADDALRFVFSEGNPPYSYAGEDGKAAGLLPEILQAIFAELPQYGLSLQALPWARAQKEIQDGRADAFITYPSEARGAYAHFSREPVFIQDYGYLVYRRGNPNTDVIRAAKSFDDLRGLLFLGTIGSEWETDNIPADMARESYPDAEALLRVLIEREHGDYFVMPPEEVAYISAPLGLDRQLAVAKVDFIPNSQINFNIGIRMSRPDAATVIARIDEIMSRPAFKAKLDSLVQAYRLAH